MKMEKSAMYYDTMYAQNEQYQLTPEKSIYFGLWQLIRKSLSHEERIIELGCGPGQLAKMLNDLGFKYRLGVDFSMQAVTMAKKMNPELNFICENAFHFLEIAPPFDTVIITEVLEHVTYDTQLLEKIPKGKRIVLSVPDFDDPAHLRHFKDTDEVLARYGKYLKHTTTETFKNIGKKWFLITGIKV